METIHCHNLKLHNLKSISLEIPKNQFTVITGVSGSGKSTLAFDIIDKVAQSKYLSAIDMIPDHEVISSFSIDGLSPTVCVSQNLRRQTNPRSTVGSRSGILSLLQSLFSIIGVSSNPNLTLTPAMFSTNSALGMCYYCYGTGKVAEVDEKTEFRKLMLDNRPVLESINRNLRMPYKKYCLAKGIDLSLPFSKVSNDVKEAIIYGDNQIYFKGLIPYIKELSAYVVDDDLDRTPCPICHGSGLREDSLSVMIHGKNIVDYKEEPISSLYHDFLEIEKEVQDNPIDTHFVTMLLQRCKNLIDLDLSYVNLNRKVPTLSGGEFQRLLMATYFDLSLENLIYIFDEPTLGLHESEKKKILLKIKELSTHQNTVLVVEHDLGALKLADHIVELGPGGGSEGGEIVFEGDYNAFTQSKTSVINNTIQKIPLVTPKKELSPTDYLTLEHVKNNNLKDVTVSIPLHTMVGIVGASGSGKSSLISQSLIPLLHADTLDDVEEGTDKGLINCSHEHNEYGHLSGQEKIRKTMYVSQKPIGRNKKSMVVSYIQIWEDIRKLYLQQAKQEHRNFTLGHFSFNSEGACEKCHGEGSIEIAGVTFPCDCCNGTKYQKNVLEVKLFGMNIAKLLEITIKEAFVLFKNELNISKVLQTMIDLGLGYLTLGQSTKTISGGEAQRIKLALELCKESNTECLYIFDEPTAGLSCRDTDKLLYILQGLVNRGNTVIVIEHDLQLITRCDYLIEMGPGSGEKGGFVIAKGTLPQIIQIPNSLIGPYCKEFLNFEEVSQ